MRLNSIWLPAIIMNEQVLDEKVYKKKDKKEEMNKEERHFNKRIKVFTFGLFDNNAKRNVEVCYYYKNEATSYYIKQGPYQTRITAE